MLKCFSSTHSSQNLLMQTSKALCKIWIRNWVQRREIQGSSTYTADAKVAGITCYHGPWLNKCNSGLCTWVSTSLTVVQLRVSNWSNSPIRSAFRKCRQMNSLSEQRMVIHALGNPQNLRDLENSTVRYVVLQTGCRSRGTNWPDL